MPSMSQLFLSNETVLRTLSHEVHGCLTQNILPFWLNNMLDKKRGGWYGRMTGKGVTEKDAPRGAILYARLLWTFSAAYHKLNDCTCLEAARLTKDYILAHFMDREYGGTFWSVTADGQPLDTKKQFYAQGFMLYGFSEYARTTGDEEAMKIAVELFDIIETHAWDHIYGGYIEACARDWKPVPDMRLSAKDENCPKSQNTHLHIIEPYTNLLRLLQEATPESEYTRKVSATVERLISLFINHILNPETHHLDLFFDTDWTRRSTTESYGHDIECSWLLHEAAFILKDQTILNKVEPIVREVAAASEKGLQSDGSMIYEGEPDGSHSDCDRHWWVQAEAVVGFFNLYQHFGNEAALTKALNCWQYIKEHLIDYERGEWYWSVRADDSINQDDDHAGFWKCPYHNGRMCMELIERIETMLNT